MVVFYRTHWLSVACVCYCAYVGQVYRRAYGTAAARWNHTGALSCLCCYYGEYIVECLHKFCLLQVHFHFKSQLVPTDDIFPRAIKNLIASLPVTELDLAFVHGRWVCLQCSLAMVTCQFRPRLMTMLCPCSSLTGGALHQYLRPHQEPLYVPDLHL